MVRDGTKPKHNHFSILTVLSLNPVIYFTLFQIATSPLGLSSRPTPVHSPLFHSLKPGIGGCLLHAQGKTHRRGFVAQCRFSRARDRHVEFTYTPLYLKRLMHQTQHHQNQSISCYYYI